MVSMRIWSPFFRRDSRSRELRQSVGSLPAPKMFPCWGRKSERFRSESDVMKNDAGKVAGTSD
jgi:hypothetical protein